jgi:hypothetical protein
MEKAKAMESAAWYRDEFGDHMKGKDKQEAPREFADAEMMYDPDADKSVHTVHEKALRDLVSEDRRARKGKDKTRDN